MKTSSKKRLLLAFLIMLSTIPILSIDMYLPALPMMVEQFHSTVGLVNLTLVLFFIFFSASTLMWGTLSDKYGRKTILLITTAGYVTASFLCALSTDVYQLIIFRVFQGISGGSAMAVSMAVIKDVFDGKERERALVYTSSLVIIAPIVAPIIGAAVLKITSWRGVFIVLTGFGMVSFIRQSVNE